MVAISTHPHPYPYASADSFDQGPALRLVAPAGPVGSPSPGVRLLLVLAAAAVVVAVAVASAAFGRVLDSHRGIPELGSSPAASADVAP